MAEQAHTQLPWKANLNHVIDANGSIVAGAVAGGGGQRPQIPYNGILANAAFIVRACNCHEDLVARLRDCRKAIASCAKDAFGFGHSSQAKWPLQSELLHYIDAALSKAAPAEAGG